MTSISKSSTPPLTGKYRDMLLGPSGQIFWDSGIRTNVIAADCRRLLCGFLHGGSTSTNGITGMQVGKGQDSWDQPPGPPPASASQDKLVDLHPFTVPAAELDIDYLFGDVVTDTPTNRLQIVATLGSNQPNWPDPPHHTDRTLREFGLVGQLDNQPILIDYVIHPAIPRDPLSTLQRTIWLVF
ncbi:hypothetical protein ACWEF9_09485 [Streptomyces sp. NPDC004980]